MSASVTPAPKRLPPPGPVTEVHLAEYWAILVKRGRLVALCVAVALLGALASALLTRPLYRATVTLNVQRERATPLEIGSVQTHDAWDPEFLPTRVWQMRSREIAERAIRRLSLLENPDIAPPSAPRDADAKAAGKASQTRMRLLAEELRKETEVSPVRGTNGVELSFTAPAPELAADVANALADSYIEWNSESRDRAISQASQFLAAQMEQLRLEVDDRERKLQAYGRSKDIISLDPQQNITMQKLEALSRDYTAAVADRVSKEARYNEVQTSKPDAIAETLSGGVVTQLRNDLSKLEREYAEKLNLFRPEWPAMQQLKAQITKGKQHLEGVIQETVTKARESAKSDYQTALRKEESLNEVLRSQKSEAMNLNSNAVEYNNLRVEASTKRVLLDALLKRQSETEVNARLAGSRESNVRVVDRALPPLRRFRPSYSRSLFLGLFLGVALGIGLAFFLEYMDRSVRTQEQVEKLLGLPALGLIPAVGSTGAHGYGYGLVRRGKKGDAPGPDAAVEKTPPVELLPHRQPRSTTAEAYRAFRTALLHSRAGGVKSLVITSGFSGEGKTSTALNLSIVFAQLGKKVLLVDSDLHKPRQHSALGLSNRVGLVSVLSEGLSPLAAIQASVIPGVSVLTSGPSSPNPSGLLASAAMAELVRTATQSYDFVVFDSPPVGPVSDALILGALVDGVVLCVKGGHTPREQVARTRDQLQRASVKILGVLINNLRERAPSYGDKYGTYEAYGYGGPAVGVVPDQAPASKAAS